MGQSPSGTAPQWVPHGSQVLPENLIVCGLLSMGCSYCQQPAPVWDLHELQGGYVLHCGVLWASRGTTYFTMVFSMGCRGISALMPGASPPLLLLALVASGLFLSHNLTPLSQLLL